MDLNFSERVTVPDDVLIRVLDGESVILNLDSESYFGLDEVGTRMWEVLTEASSIQAAYEQLLTEYEVEPAVLRADIDNLVGQLVESGLLNLAPVAATG